MRSFHAARIGLAVPLLVLALAPSLLAQDYKALLADLAAAEKSRDTEAFAIAAAELLKDDSARAVREVAEGYGRLLSGKPPLEAGLHYRLHSDLASVLGKVSSVQGRDELMKQRDKGRAWESRLLCLDACSFHPAPLRFREGAIAALKDRTPAVARRALEYLKNDRTLPTVDAVLARYLEVDLPRGPKGDDWNRLRLAFRMALTALVKVPLPAAVDYQSYIDARRDKPAELFDRPPPERGPTQLTIFGAEVTGNHMVFVIDVSGSMLATDPVEVTSSRGRTQTVGQTRAQEAQMIEDRRRINRAKKELSKVVQGLPEGKKFNIIAYSTDVLPWKKSLAPVNAESRKSALEFVAGLKAEGLTASDDALEAAFGDLSVDTIYLITDGAPTHIGTQGPDLPPDAEKLIHQIHRRVREVNYFRGVRLFTLGFPEAEESFLKKLAAENAGEYTPIR